MRAVSRQKPKDVHVHLAPPSLKHFFLIKLALGFGLFLRKELAKVGHDLRKQEEGGEESQYTNG